MDNNVSIDFIESRPLTNYDHVYQVSSVCKFNNLTFDVYSPPFPIWSTTTPPYTTSLYHVRVVDAQGLSFLGCTFDNHSSGFKAGLFALNSDIRIAERLASSVWGDFTVSFIDRSKFFNMFIGVHVNNEANFKRCVIQNTIFENLSRAIEVENTNYSKVINNNISSVNNGIIFNGSTRYKIYNNEIDGCYSGIQILNSGGIINYVNNNEINEYEFAGIWSMGRNRGIGALSDAGLRFICNNFNTSIPDVYDIYIDVDIESPSSLDGVNRIQGFPSGSLHAPTLPGSYSAGNVFDVKTSTTSDNWHFKNLTTNSIYYYYDLSVIEKEPIYHNLTGIYLSANTNACFLPTTSIETSGTIIAAKKALIMQLNTLIDSLDAISNPSYSDLFTMDSLISYRMNVIDSVFEFYLYSDSQAIYIDSLIELMNIANMPVEYVVQLSELYVMIEDFRGAKDVIEDYISNNSSANQILLSELERLIYLYTHLEELFTSDDDWANLSTTDKDSIRYISEYISDVYSSSLARYLIYRYEGVEIPDPNSYSLNRFLPHDDSKKDRLTFYPNPVKDELTIVNNNLNMENGVNVIIINTLGQVVYNQVINIDKINTSMFSSGIYFVKVIDSATNQEFFGKFIKQ